MTDVSVNPRHLGKMFAARCLVISWWMLMTRILPTQHHVHGPSMSNVAKCVTGKDISYLGPDIDIDCKESSYVKLQTAGKSLFPGPFNSSQDDFEEYFKSLDPLAKGIDSNLGENLHHAGRTRPLGKYDGETFEKPNFPGVSSCDDRQQFFNPERSLYESSPRKKNGSGRKKSKSSKLSWCQLDCQNYKHTMCQYTYFPSSSECTDLHITTDDAKRREMLFLHNSYRNWFAEGGSKWPSAANMQFVRWDDTLEKIAQTWANQCNFAHDKCRRLPNYDVGQNLALAGGFMKPKPTQDSFMMWIKESDDAPLGIISYYVYNLRYSHFSQIVWATTDKIGCGEVKYTLKRNKMRYLACNYGPSGNAIGWPMYQVGRPCSQCPSGTRCYRDSKFPNLCASPDDLEDLYNA